MRIEPIALAIIAILVAGRAAADDLAVERQTAAAWRAAVAVGDTEAPCRETIGRSLALALVRYCRFNSSATHPPCNSGNSCALIVEHVRGMCGAAETGGALPCSMTAAQWPLLEVLDAQ